LIELSKETPASTTIPMILDCESWTYHFTPDVRYGKEPLYQAFQFHKHNQFLWKFKRASKRSDKTVH
jgi:hypothetical protein